MSSSASVEQDKQLAELEAASNQAEESSAVSLLDQTAIEAAAGGAADVTTTTTGIVPTAVVASQNPHDTGTSSAGTDRQSQDDDATKDETSKSTGSSVTPFSAVGSQKLLTISENKKVSSTSDFSVKQQQQLGSPSIPIVSLGGNVRKSLSNNWAPSRQTSSTSSPSNMSESSDELPTNISTMEQLGLLPPECLSRMPDRPLQHLDEFGQCMMYALNPMTFSVLFILIVELLERFAFYGINYTQTSFLTGAYDKNWNAGMEAVSAATYVSISVAVAYTTPFIGALLADSMIGDYWTLLAGVLLLYLPGLLLIALTTIPGVLGAQFNTGALAFGLLFLWPVGTGIVKSVVNVFGARQFHPLLQSSLIESYYVNFYMSINIGALVGGVVVPFVAQGNVTIAYFLPVAMLCIGVLLFAAGTKRYVRNVPKIDIFRKTGRPEADAFNLGTVLGVSMLVVPFNIAYSQMSTTFIVQGTVMNNAFGFIDAASMNNADAIAVLVFGSFISSHVYPWLARRGIKIPTTYKFAIGSVFGVLAILWALLVEHMIHSTYQASGKRISVMWQIMSYVLIGAGEIFAVSASYEAAFAISPPEKKVLASAVNLFCVGSLPNIICIFLYHVCAPWFRNSRGTTNITHIHDYASANVDKYFWVLFAIALSGTIINVLPSVKNYVEDVLERSVDLIRTPRTPVRPPKRERAADEESPLLQAQRHQAYLKYGSGPVLSRSGSMRAGVVLSKTKERKHIKKRLLTKLYHDKKKYPTSTRSSLEGTSLKNIAAFIPPASFVGSKQPPPRSYSFSSEPIIARTDSN